MVDAGPQRTPLTTKPVLIKADFCFKTLVWNARLGYTLFAFHANPMPFGWFRVFAVCLEKHLRRTTCRKELKEFLQRSTSSVRLDWAES